MSLILMDFLIKASLISNPFGFELDAIALEKFYSLVDQNTKTVKLD